MVPIKMYHHHITNHFHQLLLLMMIPQPSLFHYHYQLFQCYRFSEYLHVTLLNILFYCLFYYTNTVFAFIHTYFIWLTRHHHKIHSLCLFHDDSIGKTNHAGEYGPADGSNKDVWKAYNRPYLKFNLEDLWGGL